MVTFFILILPPSRLFILGLHIVLTYKYGSARPKNQIEGGHDACTIPSLQMIGLRPSHLDQYHNPFQEIPFVRSDVTTINLVMRRARELGDQEIHHQVSSFSIFI